jgi:hypothetical protein
MSNWKEWLPLQDGLFPFPCLKALKLYKCPELRGHLPSHLSSIEEIDLSWCDRLLATPPALHWLSSIKNIDISGDLHSTEKFQWSWLESDSPSLLKDITIRFFDNIFSLPKMILSSSCLDLLRLHCLPSLTAFPVEGLPTSLKSLHIYDCKELSFLPPETWSNYTSLLELNLDGSCGSLSSFPLDGFPKLQDLVINGCIGLESIFVSESSSYNPSTLQKLCVFSCKALISLPQRMDTLTNLESLYLHHLPKLEFALCEGVFLPPKLQTISITSVRITKMPPLIEWGFQSLTYLSKLYIKDNDDIVNTLLKEQLLPISLVFLSICNLSEMKCLGGNGLRHLSSLETLDFNNCQQLESLSEVMLPSSLKTLYFYNCQRLESFPEHNLPSSLKLLGISKCPVLEERYENERGENWSKIAHIPVIEINDKITI